MDTPVPTPEKGWPAQPDLTPRDAFRQQIRDDLRTLESIELNIARGHLRLVKVREAMRRELAGVIGHCENLRLALEPGRSLSRR